MPVPHQMLAADFAERLAASFGADVSWPVDEASPAALSDLGLSTEQIASYFSVSQADVEALVNRTLRSPK